MTVKIYRKTQGTYKGVLSQIPSPYPRIWRWVWGRAHTQVQEQIQPLRSQVWNPMFAKINQS